MTVIQQYKDSSNTYTIEQLTEEDAVRHTNDYLDYIGLSTNKLIHDLEREELLEELRKAITKGECVSVLTNGIEQCFIYAIQESKKVLNIKALHSYYLEPIPKAKIILLDYMYTRGLNLRFTPYDEWFLPNTSIVATHALRVYRDSFPESIKCKRNFWDSNILLFLNLIKI